MIRAEASLVTALLDSSECRIHAVATPPDEIGAVEVLDRNGESLFLDWVPDCTPEYDYTVSISNRRLPIYVRVRLCGSGVMTAQEGPFVPPPSGSLPCDPAAGIPPSVECARSLEALTARNARINDNCIAIQDWNHRLTNALVSVLVFHAIAVAAAVAVVVASLFGPLGATFVAAALAAIALAAAAELLWLAAAIVISAERDSAVGADAELRRGSEERWNAARRLCCPHELAGVERLPPPCT